MVGNQVPGPHPLLTHQGTTPCDPLACGMCGEARLRGLFHPPVFEGSWHFSSMEDHASFKFKQWQLGTRSHFETCEIRLGVRLKVFCGPLKLIDVDQEFQRVWTSVPGPGAGRGF